MRFEYKKSLGQNFLMDDNKINQILNAIDCNSDDLIVEIGPGAGAITKGLVKKDCHILCFEIDTRLKEILLSINSKNLKVIFCDFLNADLNEYIEISVLVMLLIVCGLYLGLKLIRKVDYFTSVEISTEDLERINKIEVDRL